MKTSRKILQTESCRCLYCNFFVHHTVKGQKINKDMLMAFHSGNAEKGEVLFGLLETMHKETVIEALMRGG